VPTHALYGMQLAAVIVNIVNVIGLINENTQTSQNVDYKFYKIVTKICTKFTLDCM